MARLLLMDDTVQHCKTDTQPILCGLDKGPAASCHYMLEFGYILVVAWHIFEFNQKIYSAPCTQFIFAPTFHK